MRWNCQFHFVANLHLRYAQIPPGDDCSLAQHEAEWFISVHGTVELFAVAEATSVMDGDSLPFLRERSAAASEVFNLQIGVRHAEL